MKKIVLVGCHGVGKSRICNEILARTWCNKEWYNFIEAAVFISEQFREIAEQLNLPIVLKKTEGFVEITEKNLNSLSSISSKQTEEITLATYAKQLYLENLYTAQGKNILCDRSVLDTFVYYDYFNSSYGHTLLSIAEQTEYMHGKRSRCSLYQNNIWYLYAKGLDIYI